MSVRLIFLQCSGPGCVKGLGIQPEHAANFDGRAWRCPEHVKVCTRCHLRPRRSQGQQRLCRECHRDYMRRLRTGAS